MTFGSLRLRLLLAGAVSIALALLLAAYGLTVLFERHAERRIDAELATYVDQLAANLEPAPDGGIALAAAPPDPRFSEPLSGLYWQIVRAPGNTVTRSRSLWDSELALPPEPIADDAIHHHRVAGPANAELYLLQRSVELPSRFGGGTARVAVALDAAEVGDAVRAFAADLTPLLSVIAALLVAAAWVQVTVGLRPLAAIRSRLAAIRSGKSRRFGSGFPDEVRPLAQEIDGLLDARDSELARARTRAADLAHGLRTPLQVLQAEIERLEREGHAGLARQLSAITRTMQGNVERELARARRAGAHKDASVAVGPTVAQVMRVIRRTPDGERLAWRLDVPDDLAARIDRDDLSEVLGNLLENASRHAHSAVAVTGAADGATVALAVTDDGPGIPPERHAEVLARGGRLDERGSGAGLGLAIVTDIVETWGGALTLENAEPGLRATIRLPRASVPG